LHLVGLLYIIVLAPWLARNLTYKKFWQKNEVKGILADGNTGNRLIVVHVVSEAGKYSPHKHNT
jgi:5-deoxy-D-glucuronate isomerase